MPTTRADPDSLCWKEIAADRIQRSTACAVRDALSGAAGSNSWPDGPCRPLGFKCCHGRPDLTPRCPRGSTAWISPRMEPRVASLIDITWTNMTSPPHGSEPATSRGPARSGPHSGTNGKATQKPSGRTIQICRVTRSPSWSKGGCNFPNKPAASRAESAETAAANGRDWWPVRI